ncbi:protein TIFY 9-like isoform X2 [Rhodamnia argentea]|uniref:Protein TIFY n=1 Tax=Rhodamnia argentea TaxID=178133 RepID=A0A8B8Q6T0_9MYRT|nr:protein TIFY 9-like isoform X2 [Rhodamnia argentea]
MPQATVELDFFAMEKHLQTTASGPPDRLRGGSPGIQSADPSTPSADNGVQFASGDPFFVSPLASSLNRDGPNGFAAPRPAHSSLLRPISYKNAGIAPMTIFYNGKMIVFDVPRIMAENILKLAMEECSKSPESEKPATARPLPPPSHQHQWLESLHIYLPMARRKSLQRFLEKRKERLTSTSPYHDPAPAPAHLPRSSGFKN